MSGWTVVLHACWYMVPHKILSATSIHPAWCLCCERHAAAAVRGSILTVQSTICTFDTLYLLFIPHMLSHCDTLLSHGRQTQPKSLGRPSHICALVPRDTRSTCRASSMDKGHEGCSLQGAPCQPPSGPPPILKRRFGGDGDAEPRRTSIQGMTMAVASALALVAAVLAEPAPAAATTTAVEDGSGLAGAQAAQEDR